MFVTCVILVRFPRDLLSTITSAFEDYKRRSIFPIRPVHALNPPPRSRWLLTFAPRDIELFIIRLACRPSLTGQFSVCFDVFPAPIQHLLHVRGRQARVFLVLVLDVERIVLFQGAHGYSDGHVPSGRYWTRNRPNDLL